MGNVIIERLIERLRIMPGIGPKSAQRIAYYLLDRNRHGAIQLADALVEAMQQIKYCDRCRTYSEVERCAICCDQGRDVTRLCIVETPADQIALEQVTGFRGYYFVLLGRLSPLDGVGPEAIGLDRLQQRLQEGEVEEVIIATNPTAEGEATAHYISEMVHQHALKVTRIAHGIPMGGELEFIDPTTLNHAFNRRVTVERFNR
ncbi:MAG: recombination protein RecR [Gammaproteobacteria bacterium]|nr:recombination protein RecR [Gammaproteobacteria bacterium]